MTWSVKNWNKFQHYKCRVPPWIKLHKQLLDDPEWFALSGDASKMLASCWLIASENNGELPSAKVIAFRLRITEKRVTELIFQLNHWIIDDCKHDASVLLADCKHDAILELDKELDKKDIAQIAFERFWKAYPRRVGKKVAERALARALRETTIERILEAVRQQSGTWTDPKFIPHPATWLNAGRWEDQVGGNGEAKLPLPDPDELERLRERYRRKQAEAI